VNFCAFLDPYQLGGQALVEIVETTNRDLTTDEPVELIVFYAGRPDLPLTINQE
jgi:hypothetical protein